ncbi:hypothetical protein ELH84_30160 (plasmid) [Rhizobium ruizarguesonis]|nr:hypothetical protein ELH84_30160 [Rhizobium ruizarguesonis]
MTDNFCESCNRVHFT